MNINRRILAGTCFTLTFLAGVNAKATESNEGDDSKVSPFYIFPQVNISYSDNENTHFQDWEKVLSPGVSLTMGKEFSPLWGWRTALGFYLNKEARNWRDMNRDYTYIKFKDAEVFGDVTFDFSDLVFPYKENMNWKVMLFAGVGGAYVWGFDNEVLATDRPYSTSDKVVGALRGGINVSYHLNDKVALLLEGTSTFFQNRFNGVKGDRKVDIRNTVGAGVIYYFNKQKNEVTPVVPVIETPVPEVVPVEVVKKTYDVVPIFNFILPEAEVKRRRTASARAYIGFPVNKTILYPDFRNNAVELDKIRASIDVVKNDEELVIKGINLHGYASPEGSYSNNERLAKGRVEALRSLIMQEYGFDMDMMEANYTPEDWAGFKEYMEGDGYTLGDKDQIMALINDTITAPDVKERKLKSMNGGASYKFILANIFPDLRHTDYSISYEVVPFTVEQAKNYIFTQPERLNLNEMMQVANAFKGDDDMVKKVCLTAVQAYPQSSEANFNMACIYLKERNVLEAQRYLKKVNDGPLKTHALGIIEALKGNYDEARELFKKSAAAGVAESQEMLKQLAD